MKARQHQGMIDAWESLSDFDAREYVDMDVWQKNWSCLLDPGESLSSGDIMYLMDSAGKLSVLNKFYDKQTCQPK